jgi:hypothetical protein
MFERHSSPGMPEICATSLVATAWPVLTTIGRIEIEQSTPVSARLELVLILSMVSCQIVTDLISVNKRIHVRVKDAQFQSPVVNGITGIISKNVKENS